MRVVLSTNGKFHSFDLARQLHTRDRLKCIFTPYPKFKLKKEGIPFSLIRSFPWLHYAYIGNKRFGVNRARIDQEIAHWMHLGFGGYIAANLPECDLYMALSGTGLKAGRKVQRKGGVYVCDRGSSHIRYQANILKEEYARHNVTFQDFDPRGLRVEEEEYATADAITVPSSFARRSFIEMGVPEHKIHRVPYGVDLSRFYPTGTPDEHEFQVLFVGGACLRKGIPYLLESFARLRHPRKQLTFVGTILSDVEPVIRRYAQHQPITCTGPLPQSDVKDVLSRSHLLVLPSVEEGLALVQAQAMACGCPVIGTTNSGAEDLFDDGIEGFVIPIRDTEALTSRMQLLADDPDLRARMSAAALERVKGFGGWDSYGTSMDDLFCRLLEKKT